MNSSPEGGFLAALFSRLEDSGCRYAVLRNYHSLPMSLAGSDLDLVVNPHDLGTAIHCIKGACAASDGFVLGDAIRRSDFYQIFLVGRSSGAWWGACVDVFSGVYYRGAAQLVGEPVIQKRVRRHNESLNVLSDDLSAVLGVLKELLHNGVLPGRYLSVAASAFQDNWDQLRADLLSPLGAQGLSCLRDLCVTQYNTSEIKSRSRRLRNSILWTAFRRAPLHYLHVRLDYEWSKLRRVVTPPGKVMVILGTDGAGKSTLIEAIRPVIEAATHSPMTVRHLRPGLLPALARFKSERAQEGAVVTEPHAKTASGLLGSLLRMGWLLADYLLGYWLRIRPVIARSPTVLFFDRYIYDLAIDPRRFRIDLPDWFLRLVIKVAPKPDLVICLHGDPAVITERKRELPMKEIRRQTESLVAFAAREPRAVLVSTVGSIEQARDDVLIALRDHCKSRQPSSVEGSA